MSNQIYDISDVELNLNIEKIKIINRNYKLFNSIQLYVEYQDASSNVIKSKEYTIEGSDYLNWGTDDTFIVNWLLNKINLEDVSNNYQRDMSYNIIFENNTILINLVPIIKKIKLTKVEIENIAIFFGKSAWIDIILKDENLNSYKKLLLKMNTEDYLSWDNNDIYLLNWINNNIVSYL